MLTKDIINFADKLTDLSAKIAIKYYRKTNNGEMQKQDQSPVTKADQEIEALIRKEIKQKYPDHGIIGEEYGDINENSDFQWILDPIDGTSSFIIGRPTFGTLIALSYKGKIVLGIMNQPISKERWKAIDNNDENSGCWLNGKDIKTRNCRKISDAVISTTSPFFFSQTDKEKFEKLCKMAKYQKYGGVIYGGDCYSYALLASGFIDIIVEPNLQIYDYAALVPIVKMAGGKIGDFSGKELKLDSDVKFLACSSPKLYDQVFDIMN